MLHIDIPTLEEFKALAQIKGEVCVSVYLPVSPLVQNIRANRIAFRDLAREALAQLRETRSIRSGTIRRTGWRCSRPPA